MKHAFLYLALAVITASAGAQTDTTGNPASKPAFKISLNYNTGLNYYGRTDSLKSTGFFPLAEFWVNKHFYLSAAPVFVNNAVQQFAYAGTVATAGYQNVSEKWITGLYVTKPFYEQSSKLVQSALKLQSGINLSFLNPVLNLNGGADIKLSDKTDFGATAGVDHLVRIAQKNGSVLVIDPSFYVYAGSQNFQRSYYQKRTTGFLNFPGNNQLVTENVSQFTVLAYEASLPVVYAVGKWAFIASPAYVLPQNLVSVQGRPDQSEQGDNTFYTTFTAKYTF